MLEAYGIPEGRDRDSSGRKRGASGDSRTAHTVGLRIFLLFISSQSSMGKKEDKIEKKESIAERRRQSYVHQRKDFAARAGKLILANEVKIQVLLLALAIQDR